MTGGIVLSDGTPYAGAFIYDISPQQRAAALRSEIWRCDCALNGNSEAPRIVWERQRAAASALLAQCQAQEGRLL